MSDHYHQIAKAADSDNEVIRLLMLIIERQDAMGRKLDGGT